MRVVKITSVLRLAIAFWVALASGVGGRADENWADENWTDEVLPVELDVGYAVAAIDMNRDDKSDIVIVDSKRLVWLENPAWKTHTIFELPQATSDMVCMAPHDVDADGRIDLAIGFDWQPNNTLSGGEIGWLKSPQDPTAKWRYTKIATEPTTHRMRWCDWNHDGVQDLVVAPLKGTGSRAPDFQQNPIRLLSFTPPQDPISANPWKMQVIDDSMHLAHNLDVIDHNEDSKQELLVACSEGVQHIQWDGSAARSRTWGVGSTGQAPAIGSSEIRYGRLGSDGLMATIEPWHGNQVVVYREPADKSTPWQREVIDDQLQWGHAVSVTNVNASPLPEVIVGVRDDMSDQHRFGVRVYNWDCGLSKWQRTLIKPGQVAVEDLVAADFDNDGDNDIVAVGRSTHNAVLYRNNSQKEASNPASYLAIAPDRADGMYAMGEVVSWTIPRSPCTVPMKGAPTKDLPWQYEILAGGATPITSGEIKLDELPKVIQTMSERPGHLLLKVTRSISADGKPSQETVGLGGAVVSLDAIAPSRPKPDDFDSFWKDKIAQLQSIPINAELKSIDLGDPEIEGFQITMQNINGRKIHGHLIKPKEGKNLPALLQVQWAGVYPLQTDWIRWRARQGWLVMNISAHDLPNDQPASFYTAKEKGELNDYPGIGSDDRETSYFLPMFLSCYRAADYLTERSDWDGKHLVVYGGSQGGYQSIVTAGLHPAVTAFAANVPAGCDHTGSLVGRSSGWPNWASRTWQGKDAAKLMETGPYFDAMHFTANSKASGLIGLGLIDTVCPAEGILATVNRLQGEKEWVIMPQADHMGGHQVYDQALNRFLETHRAK
jgi:cephalosporin-C deacetylase